MFALDTLHWWNPEESSIPSEFSDGRIGDYIGYDIDIKSIDDVVRTIQAMTGTKYPVHPLGQVVDGTGTTHYTFVVHPKDVETFGMARHDTRWRGLFSWASEQVDFDLPQDFVNHFSLV